MGLSLGDAAALMLRLKAEFQTSVSGYICSESFIVDWRNPA